MLCGREKEVFLASTIGVCCYCNVDVMDRNAALRTHFESHSMHVVVMRGHVLFILY